MVREKDSAPCWRGIGRCVGGFDRETRLLGSDLWWPSFKEAERVEEGVDPQAPPEEEYETLEKRPDPQKWRPANNKGKNAFAIYTLTALVCATKKNRGAGKW